MWQHDPQHLRLSVCTHPLLYPPTYLTADGFSQCDCRQLMKITADICFVWSIRTVMTDRRQKSPYIPLLIDDNQKFFWDTCLIGGANIGSVSHQPRGPALCLFPKFRWYVMISVRFFDQMMFKATRITKMASIVTLLCAIAQLRSHVTPSAF